MIWLYKRCGSSTRVYIMMHYSVSAKAYGKIIFHCAKYPHRAVNGVLIGTTSKKDNSVQVQDCVPLFHAELDLTPMLEVALTQVRIQNDFYN